MPTLPYVAAATVFLFKSYMFDLDVDHHQAKKYH
jgi:hypothetical protein